MAAAPEPERDRVEEDRREGLADPLRDLVDPPRDLNEPPMDPVRVEEVPRLAPRESDEEMLALLAKVEMELATLPPAKAEED